MATTELQNADGITDKHEEYETFEPRWKRSRDCVDGCDAIKAATTDYFPALGGEMPMYDRNVLPAYSADGRALSPDTPLIGQYEKRLALAAVYEATDKTLDALLGALFRTVSTPTIPESMVPHTKNIDLAGTEYDAFKQQAGAEVLEVGRYGVLVDWSKEQNRPYWRPYETEQITNWRYAIRNGKKMLEQLVLSESLTERSSSGFGGETVQRYRVFELNDAGQVDCKVYTKRTKKDELGKAAQTGYEVEEMPPLNRQGVYLKEIPFVCFGRLDLDLCPQKPPLLGIADLQLDHYRLDGDVKWAIHVGCMGALFVAGDGDPMEKKMYFMGGVANRLAATATVEFVTLPADMVDRGKEEKAEDEKRMALMGARMLLAPKREAETAEAAVIQRDGESASLSMISHALTTALTQCWYFHAIWMGIPTEGVGDELPRDFFPHRLTPDEIAIQMQMVAEGRMSTATFLDNMYAGQITKEPDEERERIDAEPPQAQPADGAALMAEDATKADEAA